MPAGVHGCVKPKTGPSHVQVYSEHAPRGANETTRAFNAYLVLTTV